MAKLTTVEFKKRLTAKHGNKYLLLDEYKGNKVKLNFNCTICSKNFQLIPNKILSGRGCQHCSAVKSANGDNARSTTEKFKTYLLETAPNYTMLSEYTGYYNYIQLEHTTCNTKFKVKPSKFKSGTRCPICAIEIGAKKLRLTHTEFLEKFKKLNMDKYFLVLDEYIGTMKKINFQCLKCNHIFHARPHNITTNHGGCPKCTLMLPHTSRNSRILEEMLIENFTSVFKEVKYEECKYKRYLPFDFLIDDLNILIEYDGEQHFRAVNSKNGKTQFANTIKRDNIKNIFCKEYGIPLLRISYLTPIPNYQHIIDIIKTFNDQSPDVLCKRIEEMGGNLII